MTKLSCVGGEINGDIREYAAYKSIYAALVSYYFVVVASSPPSAVIKSGIKRINSPVRYMLH